MVGDEEIQTTLQHPFRIEGKGWVKAECLTIGDKVRLENRQYKQISNIWMEKKAEPVKVYNLSVEDYHTYYVSGHGVLVHNAKCSRGNVNILENVGESGRETELFLPDEYYQSLNKDIQNRYQTPNTREVYKRLGNTIHEVETSIVISDEFGRIKYRIDYSTHGNNLAHTNPHIHEFVPNLTKSNDYPSEIRYLGDSNTWKMRIGKANNDGTYNWLD